MQDPFAGRHRGQILLIAQRSPDDYVGTAGVERLLVQDHAAYRQEHTEGTGLKSSGQIFRFLFGTFRTSFMMCSGFFDNTERTSFLSKEASAEGNAPDPGGRSSSGAFWD